MRVVINAVSAKMGGAAVYIENVLPVLTRDTSATFTVFVPAERAEKIASMAPNMEVVATPVAERSFLRRFWWDQVTLRRILKQRRADVLYSSANFGMFACPCKQILLVRMPLYFSDLYLTRILPLHTWRHRTQFVLRRWLTCLSALAADIVMTPSAALLDDLRRFVRLSPDRVLVNHYGTLVDRFGEVPAKPREPGRFTLLHVSHYADHKNLGVVFRALRILHDEGFREVRFVTTSRLPDPRYPASVSITGDMAALNDPAVRPAIELLGDVSYEQLPQLYASADAFLFPSISESFGHPMIEAMASGLPTIAADVRIHREVLGDAAIYFDSADPRALARQIRRLADDAALGERLRVIARARAQQYRWTDHVQRLSVAMHRLASVDQKAEAWS